MLRMRPQAMNVTEQAKCVRCGEPSAVVTCAACDLANMTALARRWYLHALHGGRLRAEDMTILVQWLEIRARREAAKP